MTNRRDFVRALAAGLTLAPWMGASGEDGAVRRVGWLHLGSAWSLLQFREKLSDLGWIEGRNIVIESRFADNESERLPVLAAELVTLKVDVIVTQTTVAAVAAKNATSAIPVVMAGSYNPVAAGLVKSLSRPESNVTGVINSPGPEFFGKMVQLLREAAPRVSRLAVLDRAREGQADWPPRSLGSPGYGMALLYVPAFSHTEVPAALALALQQRANGLYVAPNPVNFRQQAMIAEFTLANRLPTIGGDKGLVEAGTLMSYWADWTAIRQQAAIYVDKILRGANPAQLPVGRPTKFELAINVTTARKLGLTIPPTLMLRADQVFQ